MKYQNQILEQISNQILEQISNQILEQISKSNIRTNIKIKYYKKYQNQIL
jgi:NADPH-dependent 7-cyano-7-deazaguanine reductase QueF